MICQALAQRDPFIFSDTLASQNTPVNCMMVFHGSEYLIDLPEVSQKSSEAQLLGQICGQVQRAFQRAIQDVRS